MSVQRWQPERIISYFLCLSYENNNRQREMNGAARPNGKIGREFLPLPTNRRTLTRQGAEFSVDTGTVKK
jgi:hypothetical protein